MNPAVEPLIAESTRAKLERGAGELPCEPAAPGGPAFGPHPTEVHKREARAEAAVCFEPAGLEQPVRQRVRRIRTHRRPLHDPCRHRPDQRGVGEIAESFLPQLADRLSEDHVCVIHDGSLKRTRQDVRKKELRAPRDPDVVIKRALALDAKLLDGADNECRLELDELEPVRIRESKQRVESKPQSKEREREREIY